MKKSLIILIIINFLLAFIIINHISYANTEVDDIKQSPIRTIYFGNRVTIDEDKENLYFIFGNQIYKYSLKDNTRTAIYTIPSDLINLQTSSKNGVIYAYEQTTDSETGNSNCKIYKYNVITNEALPTVTINASEHIGNDTFSNLVIDNNGYMYFRYGASSGSLISFDKNGNYIDRIENSNQETYAKSYGVSYDDKLIFFVLPNMAGTSGYIKINNGKFVEHKLMLNDIGQNWRYSDDGTYAIDHLGNVVKFTYDSSDLGSKYEVLFYTGKGLIDYNSAGVFDGHYLYALGENNVFFKYNLDTRKVEGRYKLQTTTLQDKEIYDFKVSNGKLYIVLTEHNGFDSYYYIVTKDLETNIEAVQTINVSTHKALTRSKQDIIDRAKMAQHMFNYDTNIYEEEPNYTGAPYVAGKLKEQVVQDTLNQLNFYRWLTGLNEVSLNTEYMERSQKGAVIQARLDELTHTPSRPTDMDNDWYNEAYAGVNAGNDYSGNVAYGVRIDKTPIGFILDTNNETANSVGHRSSMLDPRSNKTSFGYCNRYSAMSMYTTNEDLGNNDVWYSWPSPGYFPVEDMDTSMMWSIQLNGEYTYYPGANDLELILTSGDNKKYEITLEQLYFDSYYNNFYFRIPTELLNYLTDGENNFKQGKKVTIDFNGLIDSQYNNVNIHYTTEFIESIEKPVYTLGDVNADGIINTLDSILVLQHIAHKITLTDTQELAADTSKDGTINTLDSIKILQYMAHKITEF